jgi:hypothetical protein
MSTQQKVAELTLKIIRSLREEEKQIADFIYLYQTNAFIHSGLNIALTENRECKEVFFKMLVDRRLEIRSQIIKTFEEMEKFKEKK